MSCSASSAILDERGLVLAAAKGCSLSREQLARRYMPLVRRWAAQLNHRQHDEDLVQSILAGVLAGIPHWRGIRQWDSYVKAIVFNQVAEHRRRQKRTAFDPLPNTEEEGPVHMPSGLVVAPEHYEARELLDHARAWIRDLPFEQREAVELALNGATTREAADAMEVNENTARSRLARARAALRQRHHESQTLECP